MKTTFLRFPLISIVLALVLVSFGASSGKCDDRNPPQRSQHFYVTANFGYSGINYSGNPGIANFASTQQSSTSSHFPFAIDLAGLIQVLDPGTAIGVGFDGIYDSYSTNTLGNSGSVNQGCFVGTIRNYFGDAVGHGIFVRGDIGIDVVSLTSTQPNGFFNANTTTSSTTHGLFVLGGAGYSLDVSPHVNLSLEGDYARAFVSGGAISEWQPKAGILVSF